jgi:hypothetical protein
MIPRPLQNRTIRPATPAYDHHVPRRFRGTNRPVKGRGLNPAGPPSVRRQHEPNPAAAAQPGAPRHPPRTCGHARRACSPGSASLRQPAGAQTREPRPAIANSCGSAEWPAHRFRGRRSFLEVASATLLEAAFPHERDDATRLAQRCTLRPHARRPCTTQPCGCGRVRCAV